MRSQRILVESSGDHTSTFQKLLSSMSPSLNGRVPVFLSISVMSPCAGITIASGGRTSFDKYGPSLLSAFCTLGNGPSNGLVLCGKNLCVGVCDDGTLELGPDQGVWLLDGRRRKDFKMNVLATLVYA